MNKESCFELGFIQKNHGFKGAFWIHLDVDFPEDYTKLESVFVEVNHNLVPFFFEKYQFTSDGRVLAKFEEIDSEEALQSLKGARLFLPLDVLPKLQKDQFYYHEVKGYQVIDVQKGEIGMVTDFYEAGPQVLMAVDHQGVEVLVPVNDFLIKKINKPQQVLEVELPDGLLEVYLSEED